MERRRVKNFLTWFVLIAVILFPRELDRGFLSSQLEKILSATLGFPVEIGRLELQGVTRIDLQDVRVIDDETDKPFLLLKRLQIDYRFDELLQHRLRRIALQSPQITIDQKIAQNVRERFKPQVAVDAAEKNLKISKQAFEENTNQFQIDDWELTNAQFNFDFQGKSYHARDFQLSFHDLNERGVKDLKLFVDLAFGHSSAGSLLYQAGEMNFLDHQVKKGNLQCKGFDFAILASALQPWLPPVFQGGKAKGKLDLDLLYPDVAHGAEVKWRVNKFGLESADGSFALADFEISGKAVNHLDQSLDHMQVDFQSQVTGGQLLAGTFFQDFKSHTATLSGQTILDRKSTTIHMNPLHMSIAKAAVMNVTGSCSRSDRVLRCADLRASADLADLETVFRLGGRELLSRWAGAFFRESTAQGKLKLDFTWKEGILQGEIKGDDVTLVSKPYAFELIEADLDFPFYWHSAKSKSLQSTSPIILSWKSVRKGPFAFGSAETQLELKHNQLSLDYPFAVELWGGEIVLPRLVIADVHRPLFHLESELLISRLNLAMLSREMNLEPMQGMIFGALDDIQIQDGELRTIGMVQANAFQGDLTLRNFWGNDLASANRQIGFDASIRNINLGHLSRMTNFGYINGVLQGDLKGLVLSGNLPSAFDLDFETIDSPGVDMKVGIDAVRKIAIFAGASSALEFLDQGIYGFVDTYHYEALGAHAVLSKGILRLQAKLRRGEQKLFLKGRSFPRIDVVYNEGGGEVTFETILQQIEAIKLKLNTKEHKS